MDKILSINTIKNVFAALGAKTSDSNYAVGLFDKTSGEPKGLMDMSNLASVLGATNLNMVWAYDHDTYRSRFKQWVENVSIDGNHCCYIGLLKAGWVAMVFGFKFSNLDGKFYIMRAGGTIAMAEFGYFDGNGEFIITYQD